MNLNNNVGTDKIFKMNLFIITFHISGDGESGYDNLDTSDERNKGDIDNVLGVQVMPTTFTVTQVQTVYATIPPSVIQDPVDGIPATAIVDSPDNRCKIFS